MFFNINRFILRQSLNNSFDLNLLNLEGRILRRWWELAKSILRLIRCNNVMLVNKALFCEKNPNLLLSENYMRKYIQYLNNEKMHIT